uniref:Uncharacterized protein n=1 Tax=Romanomermis culicivorax TaxID=13658 RepID=A0A915JMP7_ROMCU
MPAKRCRSSLKCNSKQTGFWGTWAGVSVIPFGVRGWKRKIFSALRAGSMTNTDYFYLSRTRTNFIRIIFVVVENRIDLNFLNNSGCTVRKGHSKKSTSLMSVGVPVVEDSGDDFSFSNDEVDD